MLGVQPHILEHSNIATVEGQEGCNAWGATPYTGACKHSYGWGEMSALGCNAWGATRILEREKIATVGGR